MLIPSLHEGFLPHTHFSNHLFFFTGWVKELHGGFWLFVTTAAIIASLFILRRSH
ncbi:MAG: hypothetical protein Q7S98_04340 [Deltaproteobacteria bacterium]|nr:hypothetical protein [Deltaproteobacteria bacterium]